MAAVPTVGESERKLTSIQEVRRSIDAKRLIERLNRCIFGRTKLRPDQQFAIKTQLNKVLPDLQAIEYQGEVRVNVVRSRPPTTQEWLAKYGDAEDVNIDVNTVKPSDVLSLSDTTPGLPQYLPTIVDSGPTEGLKPNKNKG